MYLGALLCAVLVNELTQIKQLKIVKMKSEIKQQFEALNTDSTEILLYYRTTHNTVHKKVILI